MATKTQKQKIKTKQNLLRIKRTKCLSTTVSLTHSKIKDKIPTISKRTTKEINIRRIKEIRFIRYYLLIFQRIWAKR